MTTITVGTNKQFTTIASAVTASHSGDVIKVDAGTYTNDFTRITQSLTLQAVGGIVTMNATVQPPNGKAILTEGNAGIDVSIDGFAFAGATVADANGAGIRYEGGNLKITNSHFYNNQNGILGASDPNGTINISHTEFDHNGGGTGNTHNMYIGDIKSFTLTDSFTHDANVGHEIKSRAENNTITNNRIFDNDSSSSYEIDIPNGGNTVISGNLIQQGPNSENSNIIAYGEEGSLHAGTALSVTGNTIINDKNSGPALWNASDLTNATFTNNSVYGFNGLALVSGTATQSGTTVLGARPTLDQSAPYAGAPISVPPVVVPPVVVPPVVSPGIPPVVIPPVVGPHTTITVGTNKQFTTIASAVAASHSGDVIQVDAGTYTNDFTRITQSLTLQAVGGIVTMNATVQPPNGKAILTEGNAGIDVSIDGFAFAGATVADANGAGIRYEGGNLKITNSHFYNNQNGILGASDPNGTINISHTEFDHNGGGTGNTHNMYIGDIKSFTLTDSFTHDANVGHEIKSRAENNTITNNRIFDNDSSSSYEIDIPNGGNTVISGNLIQQGPNSENSNIIAYGEEGSLHAGTALSVTGNTIINDKNSGPALWNASDLTNATFANNSVYGFNGLALVAGVAAQSGTTVLGTRPTLNQSAPYAVAPISVPPVVVPPVVVPPVVPPVIPPVIVPPVIVPPIVVPPVVPPVIPPVTPAAGIVLGIAEDAWNGNAQYTVSVDGTQVGGLRTATASHAAGKSEQVSLGTLSAGVHNISVNFINDAYGGSALTDRNLYLTGATNNGQAIAGSTVSLLSNGAATFSVGTTPVTPPVTPPVTIPVIPPVTIPVTPPVTTPPTGGFTLGISEDAWNGNAQYTVSVDGNQVGGVRTASASHAAGQSEQVSLGTLSAGLHNVSVSFINDAYGGSAVTDRNLYLTGATNNGQAVAGSTATLLSNGAASFQVLPSVAAVSPTSTLTLHMSEDAYLGNAQFSVAIDGKQMGGNYAATASHGAGQSTAFVISGITETFSPHDIAVSFLNDAYGGSAATDRNLYIDSMQFDRGTVAGSAGVTMLSTGTQHFTAIAPAGWAG